MGVKLTSVTTAAYPPNGVQLIDSATPAGVQPTGLTGKTLVFSDEFSTGTLDTGKWATSYPDTSFWNATTPGGHLTNTGEPEAYDPSGISFDANGMVLTMRNQVTVTGLPYTSGMVTSYPSFNPTFGVFEARMQLLDVAGAWPAFWMFPTDQVWPPEIDIMENFGKASFNNQISAGFIRTDHTNSAQATVVNNLQSQWHTYACEWRSNIIQFYVDGAATTSYTGTGISAKAMFLLCNLAGNPSQVPATSALPMSVHVDYIRAWA